MWIDLGQLKTFGIIYLNLFWKKMETTNLQLKVVSISWNITAAIKTDYVTVKNYKLGK